MLKRKNRSRTGLAGRSAELLCRAALLAALTILLSSAPAVSQIAFQEVTSSAGVAYSGTTNGLAWGNLDGDGLPDLYVGHHGASSALYLSDGLGGFTNAAHLLVPDGSYEDWHGAAWADLENDGDDDLIMIAGAGGQDKLFQDRLWINDGGSLVEQAAALGIDDLSARGRMPLWWDWNGDGLLDVVAINAPSLTAPSKLFENTPTGFVSHEYLPIGAIMTFAQLGDLEGDGIPELMIGGGWPYSYRVFDTTVTPFSDVTNAMGLGEIRRTGDAALADLDGDLFLDLFLTRYYGPRSDVEQGSPLNIRTILFADSIEIGLDFAASGDIDFAISHWWIEDVDVFIGSAGTNPASLSFTLSPSDPNHQGLAPHTPATDPGVYIGYDIGTAQWQIRASNWTRFEAIIDAAVPFTTVSPVGFVPQDDTDEDKLYLGSASGFVEATAGSGLAGPTACRSVSAGDFDNDMDLDLFLACTGHALNQPNRLYENQGNGTFVLVPNAGGAAGTSEGRGDSVAVADYDVDGFLDLFVSNGYDAPPIAIGPQQLFRNLGNTNHWIEVDLIGTVSNRDGIGARVEVTAGGVTQLREMSGGMHARSQDYKRLHFGLGPNTAVDTVTVRWPSGLVQQLGTLPVDQVHVLTEPSGSVPALGFWSSLALVSTLFGSALVALRVRRA